MAKRRFPWETLGEFAQRLVEERMDLETDLAEITRKGLDRQAEADAVVLLARHGLDESDLIRVRGMGVRL